MAAALRACANPDLLGGITAQQSPGKILPRAQNTAYTSCTTLIFWVPCTHIPAGVCTIVCACVSCACEAGSTMHQRDIGVFPCMFCMNVCDPGLPCLHMHADACALFVHACAHVSCAGMWIGTALHADASRCACNVLSAHCLCMCLIIISCVGAKQVRHGCGSRM